MKPNEQLFEAAIEESLLGSGYLKSLPEHFNPVLGLDVTELGAFLEESQPNAWKTLVERYGNSATGALSGLAKRLAKQLDDRGTVDVLRHGMVDLGVTLQLAYFKPAHSLTDDLMALYRANRVTVTRQFPYEANSGKTIDLALMVNGIPVATAELKNPLTGQNIEHAISQYRHDRDPKNLTLSRRALVHFAVDPDRVAMTTRLAGSSTQFLPFNKGQHGGQGNPPNPNGHRSSYLWEQVLERDAWMDILARFINVEYPATGSPAEKKAKSLVIFPRYHQWDAVLKMEADAKANGAGRSYLIQHSAGSGKSNTIAWIAHRLSSLHDETNTKVFDKVVVITDRVILDKQLQDTIYQFEHAHGVVVKIDQNSGQLAEALAGAQARIIITTLQKFPFILDKVADLPSRRYAVIVDEAHSSQTGESAKDLKLALGATHEQELTVAEAEDAGLVATPEDPVETALAKAVGARGHQSNLSFFAFTATPKARTLEMFGTMKADTGKYEPFHLYPMRQAVEEGFIRDVLENYTTYKTYWRIEKTVREDPEFEVPKANRAIAHFVELHPSNLSQRAEIIVEHFYNHVAHQIGGQAKAMVVTSSRLAAVRYKQAIDAYIKAKGYTHLATIVAFSGKVIDEVGLEYTESGMNAFPESHTPQKVASDDYQVLIVAEKFQTGFSQPLLHTMYVDKVLVGLNAVQTLSRLNRIHPLKDSTFVLDFRNEAEDIVTAFEPYYGKTIAPPTDPNLLWDTRARLDEFGVLEPTEMVATVGVLVAIKEAKDHAKVYALLDPAVERFNAMAEESRLAFVDALNKFVRTYSFLSQLVSFGDTKLERDYTYCRALASRLRTAQTSEKLDLGSELELTHLRNEVTFKGSLNLTDEEGEVTTIYGEGKGKENEPPVEHLSQIIEELNKRFGLNLTESDQLFFDQILEDFVANEEVGNQARNNTFDNFRLAFEPRFMNTVVGRMDANEAIFKKILDDADFQDLLKWLVALQVYRRSRSGAGSQ